MCKQSIIKDPLTVLYHVKLGCEWIKVSNLCWKLGLYCVGLKGAPGAVKIVTQRLLSKKWMLPSLGVSTVPSCSTTVCIKSLTAGKYWWCWFGKICSTQNGVRWWKQICRLDFQNRQHTIPDLPQISIEFDDFDGSWKLGIDQKASYLSNGSVLSTLRPSQTPLKGLLEMHT